MGHQIPSSRTAHHRLMFYALVAILAVALALSACSTTAASGTSGTPPLSTLPTPTTSSTGGSLPTPTTGSSHSTVTPSPPPSFQQVPGKANDISVGADGTVWALGTNAVTGSYGIYRWNGSSFQQMPGAGVRIAIDPHGNAWVTNSSFDIYRWTSS